MRKLGDRFGGDMPIAGIIGGIGPESTIEYYRFIIEEYRQQRGTEDYPSLVINSVNLNRLVKFFEAGELGEVTKYLATEIQRLAQAGADFGALSANTPHVVFEDVQKQSPIPLISIVEATREEAKNLGLKKVALFGTRFTMQGAFYPKVFSRAGITLVTPLPDEQSYLHDKYMNELVKGVFLDETRKRMLSIAERMKREERIEGLILGGTELPLILRGSGDLQIPFLDTTRIHVRSIVARLLS